MVAGVKVINGKISAANKIYIYRNGVPISEATLPKAIKVFKK